MDKKSKEGTRTEKKRAGKNFGPISRRDFALTSLAALGVSSITKATDAVSKAATETAGISPSSAAVPTFNLTFDKWDYRIQVDPEYTLQEILCNQLGAVSIRNICDGAWQSCSVAVDGKPILFCTRSPAIGKKV